jgi:hypothetical protein
MGTARPLLFRWWPWRWEAGLPHLLLDELKDEELDFFRPFNRFLGKHFARNWNREAILAKTILGSKGGGRVVSVQCSVFREEEE